MKERAREVLRDLLKSKNDEFQKNFELVAKSMAKELDIPERIARQLVLDELVSKNEKQLILYDIFSPSTLKKNNL